MRRCWLKGQTGDAACGALRDGLQPALAVACDCSLGLAPIVLILARLHWIVNVPSDPLVAHRECFRQLNLSAPTKYPVGLVHQAN